ncbi:MAG TPA: hypothetical protein VNM66_07085 [Thermodesulfobacteriota bacterium]|nr:hypothetical protein [Thermodesulfobacteriota bacterium]
MRRADPVLVVGPAPVADDRRNVDLARLSEQLEFVADELGIPYLDVFTPLHASPLWRRVVAAGDDTRPGAAGYSVLAGLVDARDSRRAGLP